MPPPAGDPSIDEAEAEAARAQARAEAARARAVQLRKQADEALSPGHRPRGGPQLPLRSLRRLHSLRRPRWLRRPSWLRPPPWKAVAVGAALALTCALFAASGFMWRHHRLAVQDRQRSAEFTAAARQGAVNLMSIDFNTAKQDVQRVIDDSTGPLKGQYQDGAQQLIKAIQDAKVVTKATVTAVAVESMTRDSAVTLVAATTQRHNAQDPTDRPATWRMTITLQTVGGQPRMSKVEFLG